MTFQTAAKKELVITSALISEALSYIPPDCSHEEWSQIGFSIHSHDPSLFALWDQWSSGSEKKYPGSKTLERQWSRFNPEKGVGIGTLFKTAKSHGFQFTKEHFEPNGSTRRNESEDRQRLERQRIYRERLAAEAEVHRNGLTREERDFSIRAIAKHVGLNSAHHQSLKDRGLNDEAIAKGLFFSVTHGQLLPNNVSDRFAGCHLFNGQKLLSVPYEVNSGIACVAFDYEGLAIGYQVRNDDKSSKLKYPWAKSTFSSNLQSGELPISVMGSSPAVMLTEGILKPFIASHRLNIRCIGASSGGFLGSPLQFRSALGSIKKVVISPDAGDINNPQVLARWQKIIDSFNITFQVHIAWWGQVTKDCPDIDELDDLKNVQFLTKKEWASFVSTHQNQEEKCK